MPPGSKFVDPYDYTEFPVLPNENVPSFLSRIKEYRKSKNYPEIMEDDLRYLVVASLFESTKKELQNNGIDTHGTSEVYRYALNRHIEKGDKQMWSLNAQSGQKFFIVSPVLKPTDRYMFRQLGKMVHAKDMVTDITTEYWMAFRCAVMTRQMFNMPDFILQQFYNRYLNVTSTKTKYKLESKEDMQKRGLRSPNRADAAANCLETIRRNGRFSFKFVESSKYNEVYGKERDQKKLRQIADKKMNSIAKIMGLGLRVTNGELYSTPRRRRSFDFETV